MDGLTLYVLCISIRDRPFPLWSTRKCGGLCAKPKTWNPRPRRSPANAFKQLEQAHALTRSLVTMDPPSKLSECI